MRVAIITGAGSGLGLGIAKALHRDGFAIVGTGRDEAKLAMLRDEIGVPDHIETVAVDMTSNDAPHAIIDAALARWGRADAVINNAGVGSPTPVHETTDDGLDYFLDLMLRAPFRLIREALPHLQSGAAIVNITSVFAILGGKRGGPYSAAKGGMDALTKHIACEYGPAGIRCNAVAPAAIPTPMTFKRFEDERFRRMNVDMTPFPRLGTVDDVAEMVAFLCSDRAAFINGQTIAVDGGWTTTKYLSDRALTSKWVEE